MNGFDLLMNCQRLEDKRLSLVDKAILCGIASFFNEKKGCSFPSLRQLQERVCCGDHHTVIRAIKRLTDFGLLSVTQQKGIGNQYMVSIPSSAKSGTTVESTTPVETSSTVEFNSTGDSNTTTPVEITTTTTVETNTQKTKGNTKEKQKGSDAVAPSISLTPSATPGAKCAALDFYGLPDDLISEWRQFRKLKKAPITQRVIDAHLREARDARLSLQQAVEYAMNVGWTAFSANFYRNREKKIEEKYDPFDVRNLNKPSPRPFHIKTNDAEEDAAFAEFMSK